MIEKLKNEVLELKNGSWREFYADQDPAGFPGRKVSPG